MQTQQVMIYSVGFIPITNREQWRGCNMYFLFPVMDMYCCVICIKHKRFLSNLKLVYKLRAAFVYNNMCVYAATHKFNLPPSHAYNAYNII